MLGLAESNFFHVLLSPLLIGAILGVIFALTFSLQDSQKPYLDKLKPNLLPALGYLIPVALVGYIPGYLTGISRAPAVGNMIPAVLAVIGGLNIYFFGIESKNRVLVGYCVTAFTLVLFYGLLVG